MPLYEVRRRTVLAIATVEAEDEMRARLKARDAWQQDAAIASLQADVVRVPNLVVRVPNLEPYDWQQDERSELRYEETDADREDEATRARRGAEAHHSPAEEIPWP